MKTDSDGYITHVEIGGKDAWYMLGHAFWSEKFSTKFLCLLENEYDFLQTIDLYWENIFVNHINVLKMKIKKYPANYIFEFDSIDELRQFDTTYITDTRSKVLKRIAEQLGGAESEISGIEPLKNASTEVVGIRFEFRTKLYNYTYHNCLLRGI